MDSIPGRGTNITHVTWHSMTPPPKKKKKERFNMGLAVGNVLAKLARVVTDGQEKEGGSNSVGTSFKLQNPSSFLR